MSVRWTQKPQVNIKLETGKYHKPHTREHSFITGCLKELREKGYTVCFEQWQVDEIIESSNLKDIKIEFKDYYFYLYI